MDEQVFERLETNLQKQLEIYSELKNIANLMQQAIVRNQIKELDLLVSLEENLIIEAGKVEAERSLLIDETGLTVGVAYETMDFSKLEMSHPQLVKVQNELRDIIYDLEERNRTNTELLKQGLMICNFSLNLLTDVEEKTYNRDGNKVENKKQKVNKSFILDKTV